MNSVAPRFLKLRLLLQFGEDLFRFRLLRYTDTKPCLSDNQSWYRLGFAETAVRQRPELGEQNANRLNNMKVACSLLNGVRLAPRALVSMKRIVGNPTPARGFTAGPAFSRGSLVSSCGGGLCQVSTTLFMAALNAGLTIVERRCHSIDLWGEARLVPLGLDAAYAFSLKDLKISNPYAERVRLRMCLRDDPARLACWFESTRERAPEIKIETRLIRTLVPDRVPAGFRIVQGYEVETIRFVKKRGKWVDDYHAASGYRPAAVPVDKRD